MYDHWIKYFSKPIKLQNALSDEEVNYLQDQMFKHHTKRKMKKGGTIHFNFNRGTYDKFVLPKLPLPKDINDVYSEGNFYITSAPYKLHTDITDDQNILKEWIPWKTVLIPLWHSDKKDPLDFGLILFEQRYLGLGNNFDKTGKIKTFSWGTISEYNRSSFINHMGICEFGDPISYDFWCKNLMYQEYETYNDLSIEEILPYNMGDILIFDCCQLHTSLNMANGYKSALNLTIFIK